MTSRAALVPVLAIACLAACAAGASGDLGLGEGAPNLVDGGTSPPVTASRDATTLPPVSPATLDAAATGSSPGDGEAGSVEADASQVADDASAVDAGGIAVVVAPASPGAKATAVFDLPATSKLARLTVNSCSGTSLRLGPATSFAYVEVRNGGPREKVVSVWTSRAPGGVPLDTIVAAYASSAPPASDGARLACAVGVEQGCSSTGGDATACVVEAGGEDWAGLMVGDGRGVSVPAWGAVVIYVAAYDALGSGAFALSVRTEQLL